MATSRTQIFKLTQAQKAEFLAQLRLKGMVHAAALVAGINRKSVYNWRAKDPKFRAAWDEALEDNTDVLEESAYQRALAGDTTLTIFLLKARRPDVYRDNLRITVEQMDRAIDAAIAARQLPADSPLLLSAGPVIDGDSD